MNICRPIEARAWFKKKERTTWIATIAAFISLLAILSQFNDWWLAIIFAGVGSFGLFVFLDKRSPGIECINCKRIIATNTPWLCGFGKDGKLCRNENTNTYPFINECEHCHFIPKAYQCHHCGSLIYLSMDRQEFQFARCLVNSKPNEERKPVVVRDVVGEKVATQKEDVRDLEHKLRKTELEKQIEIEKNKPTGHGIKTPEQALKEEIETAVNGGMTLYTLEHQLKEKADVEFAKDEHKRQQKHALIEMEIMKRMG
jgi:hypothetical protein